MTAPRNRPEPVRAPLILALIATAAIWIVPALRILVLPLDLLDSHLHEFCHAIVALASGGQVSRIFVFQDANGVTLISGGSIMLTGSAGYVGSSIIGALIIATSRDEAGARRSLWIVSIVLLLSLALWVRGDVVGVVALILWAAALILLARYAKDRWLLFCAQFLGLVQCATSIQALLVVLRVATSHETQTDAEILNQATGVPSLLWALSWSLISAVLIALALRRAWSEPKMKAKPAA